jgi:hypothetical protein
MSGQKGLKTDEDYFCILIFLFSSTLIVKTTCEVKNYQECLVTNKNNLVCENN